jgi:hypothetical protein
MNVFDWLLYDRWGGISSPHTSAIVIEGLAGLYLGYMAMRGDWRRVGMVPIAFAFVYGWHEIPVNLVWPFFPLQTGPGYLWLFFHTRFGTQLVTDALWMLISGFFLWKAARKSWRWGFPVLVVMGLWVASGYPTTLSLWGPNPWYSDFWPNFWELAYNAAFALWIVGVGVHAKGPVLVEEEV